MISVDTNILFKASVREDSNHGAAANFIMDIARRRDVAISEFVLVELYRLLRNPAVMDVPLTAHDAVNVIQGWRRHRHWRLVGFCANSPGLHADLWAHASTSGFAYRRIYDVRLALSLQHHGVREFATCNTKDFTNLGFERVWNPLV